MERREGAIAELDGLRGVAIALVVARHSARLFERASGGAPLWPVAGWDAASALSNGWAGVDLFFVLSGLLVTSHALARLPARPRARDLGRYALRRALRIVPAYYAVLALVASGALAAIYPVSRAHLGTRVAYHLAFLQDYLPSDLVVAFWSLGVEEKFYLAVPALVLALRALRGLASRLALLAAVFAAACAARAVTFARAGDAVRAYEPFFARVRSPFHLCLDALAVGCACAVLLADPAARRALARPRVAPALLASGAALTVPLLVARPWLARPGPFAACALLPLLALGFGAVVLAVCAQPGRLARPLRSRTLFVLAELSYSLYLVHLLFVGLGWRVARALPLAASLPRGALFPLHLLAYGALALAASLALHYAVEKPFLVLKARLESRWRSTR